MNLSKGLEVSEAYCSVKMAHIEPGSTRMESRMEINGQESQMH